MLWWVVASTSVVLIAAGLWLILRDVEFARVGAVIGPALGQAAGQANKFAAGTGARIDALRHRFRRAPDAETLAAATVAQPPPVAVTVETLAARLAHVAPEPKTAPLAQAAATASRVSQPPMRPMSATMPHGLQVEQGRPNAAPAAPVRLPAAAPAQAPASQEAAFRREEDPTVPLLLPPERDAIYAGRVRPAVAVADTSQPIVAAPPPPNAIAETSPAVVPAPARSALDELSDMLGDGHGARSSDVAAYPRDAALEARWRQIAPLIQVAALGVNERTAGARFALAPEGDAGWSAGNAGFGHFRRVMVAGGSVAWLRIELRHENRLAYSLRAHAPEHVMLNADVALESWPVSEDQIARGLVDAVRGVVLFATARSTPDVAQDTSQGPTAAPPPPAQSQAAPRAAPLRPVADSVASLQWQAQPQRRIVDEAISLVNGAFSDVKARLVALPPPQGSEDKGTGGRHERAFQIQYQARPAGLLLVDDAPDHIGLSVGVSDPSRLALAQRSALKRDGTGPYELAEAIATCIWPTLALEGADTVLH